MESDPERRPMRKKRNWLTEKDVNGIPNWLGFSVASLFLMLIVVYIDYSSARVRKSQLNNSIEHSSEVKINYDSELWKGGI